MFLNLVSDFHYHVVWAAKKLARGETLVARECLDGYLRQLYLRCCAWEAISRGSSPPAVRLSRFFEIWASQSAIKGMATLCTRYEALEVARSLRASIPAFSSIAVIVADAVCAAYPADAERKIRDTTARILGSDHGSAS